MPKFLIENFKDPPVEVDVPIEKVSKGTLYQLVLSGNEEAIAYVKTLVKEAKDGKPDDPKIPEPKKAEQHPGNQGVSLKDVIVNEIERQRAKRVALEYNEDQPRHPPGSPEGGQFAPKEGGGGGGADTPEVNKSGRYIDGVGDVDKYLAENPQKPGEAIFEYQSRITAGLEPDQRHALLFEARERYEPVAYIKEGADRYREEHGLPNPQVDPITVPAPLAKGEIVAREFEQTPDESGTPRCEAAYDDFKRQNDEMFNFMTKPESQGGMGIKVDYSPYEKGDPYPSAKEQADDLRDNHHITIQSGLGGEHSSTMTTEEYDRFRAVHDTFGHTSIGSGFDRHGEYEAYLVHRSMYTGEGAKAMSSEYHGVNTALWAGEKGTPGTGKSIIMDERLIPNPWDEHGNLVKARARSREEARRQIAFAKKAEPLLNAEQTVAIKYLADQLELTDEFAADYDALPWHYSEDHAPRASQSFATETVALEYDEDQHPRDEQGRWTSDGGGSGKADEPKGGGGGGSDIVKGPDGSDIALKPGSQKVGEGAGTPDDPIYVDSDINLALGHLADGDSIRLDDEKAVSTLVADLGDYAEQLKEHGENPPDFNLCDVSVEGTNLFCAENKDIPRAEMPQLGGKAVEGTQAAKDAGGAGKFADGSAAYVKALEDSDIPVKDATVAASMLKASQNELDGEKVAAIAKAMREPGYKESPNPIYTTKDGYLLDGHHRWAAAVVNDLLDGKTGDVKVPVREVGMEIGAAIDFTNAFAKDYGIAAKKTGE